MIIRTLCLLVLLAPPLHALDRDPAGYEQFLLPIYVPHFPGQGAFGSLWVTEFSARNEGDTPTQFFQAECVYFCECPGLVSCGPGSPAEPRSIMHTAIVGDFSPANRGVFLYVGKSGGIPVFQLRVRDISREHGSWGTEVPVVRSSEFRTTPIYLLDIPIRDGYRQHLRVYGASSPSGLGDVRVRVYAADTNDVLAERILSLRPGSPSSDRPALLPSEDSSPELPAYAEIPQIAGVLPGTGAGENVRLEIAPLTPGLRFWAFVSITNNETQHVTLVTPQ